MKPEMEKAFQEWANTEDGLWVVKRLVFPENSTNYERGELIQTIFLVGAEHGAKQKAKECVGFAHELILSILHPGTPDHMTRKEAAQLLRILMGKMQHPEQPWPCDQAEQEWAGCWVNLTREEFEALSEYPSVLPGEDTIGHRWKTKQQGIWFMVEYAQSPEAGMTRFKRSRIAVEGQEKP